MNAVLKPQSNQPEPRIEAVFKTSRAMATLWEIASDHLSLRQLEWFANGASEQVGNDLRALSRVLEGTGCLVAVTRIQAHSKTRKARPICCSTFITTSTPLPGLLILLRTPVLKPAMR